MEYTLALALEDYLPVVLSGVGFILLARMIAGLNLSLGRMAAVAVVLILAGGLLKASWKLIIAASGADIAWMSQSLFPLIGPGFTLFAWALYQVRRELRQQPPLRRPWLVPLALIALFTGLAIVVALRGGPWRLAFLALSTLGNFSILTLLIIASWRRGMWLTGAVFLANLVVILALTRMAQIPNQTIALQWFEQSVQTISQALFALAAWQYGRRMQASYRQEVVAQPLPA